MKANAIASTGISAVFGLLTVGASMGIMAAIAKVGAFTIFGVPGALLGLGGGAIAIAGYREIYRSTVKRAEREMERALRAVEASLRAEEVFGGQPPTRSPLLPRDSS